MGAAQDPQRAVGGDPWVGKLTWAAIACAALAAVLFVVFKLALGSGVSTLRDIATQGRG